MLKYNLFFFFIYFLQKASRGTEKTIYWDGFSKSRLVKVLNDGQFRPTREAVDVVDIVDVVDEWLRMGDITVAYHGGGKKRHHLRLKDTSFAFKEHIICV